MYDVNDMTNTPKHKLEMEIVKMKTDISDMEKDFENTAKTLNSLSVMKDSIIIKITITKQNLLLAERAMNLIEEDDDE